MVAVDALEVQLQTEGHFRVLPLLLLQQFSVFKVLLKLAGHQVLSILNSFLQHFLVLLD